MRQEWNTVLGLVTAAAIAAFGINASAQKTTPVHPGRAGARTSSRSGRLTGRTSRSTYGRPSMKGRSEAELMPPGTPWRTGADEATTITTDKPLKFGTLSLAPGSYTINTEPGDKGWQLIIGKLGKPGQWGVPYNATLEIGRAPMTVTKTKAPVEQLTISVDDTPTGGTLRVEWGGMSALAPFTVG